MKKTNRVALLANTLASSAIFWRDSTLPEWSPIWICLGFGCIRLKASTRVLDGNGSGKLAGEFVEPNAFDVDYVDYH